MGKTQTNIEDEAHFNTYTVTSLKVGSTLDTTPDRITSPIENQRKKIASPKHTQRIKPGLSIDVFTV